MASTTNHEQIITSPLQTTDTAEECTKRLSKGLSEYERASTETAGRANLLRKERDAERLLNQKLRKEIDKLSNKLLCERSRNAILEKDIKELSSEGDDLEETGNDDHNLTRKLIELKKLIERIRKVENNHSSTDIEGRIHDNMAALAMLQQGIQNYLEMKIDPEDTEDGVEAIDPVDTLVSGLKHTHVYLDEKKKHGKAQVSMWMKLLVYLCPIFLSVLCYIAFTSVKR